MSPRSEEGPATSDRVFSLYGRRFMPPLGERLAELGGLLVKKGALALLMLDAAPVLQIERLYGARALRATLESLTKRVQSRVEREFGDELIVTSGALHEEHLLVFLPRPRSEADFFLHELPRLAEELRAWTAVGLKRIVYPYLTHAPEIPIGCEFVLHRPHQRP